MRSRLAGALAALGGALLATLVLGLAALGVTRAASPGDAADAPAGFGSSSSGAGVSTYARAQIPPLYLRLYVEAARRYGVDWAVLAGIGKVECDDGRDPDPSCTREGFVNAAGAGGPMQFLAATWAQYGVDADGDGRADRWDPADAIYAAARYLRAAGAPGDYRRALYAYNHAGWYVADVLRLAAAYRAPAVANASSFAASTEADNFTAETTTPVRFVAGDRAALSATDGHVALIPADAPAVVQAMVIAGNELQDLPYGPAGHPDPRGASSEDCSSTVNYVLYRAGVRPLAEIVRENPLAQDYVTWGLPGPGRWVTIYATTRPTNHVFIVIAGLRLDTSHDGTDVGPNRDEDGPRWRVLDHIPTWAHWSVRHPAGL